MEIGYEERRVVRIRESNGTQPHRCSHALRSTVIHPSRTVGMGGILRRRLWCGWECSTAVHGYDVGRHAC
eukprot:13653663-Alexandrium_andersonii.AAC.1